MGLFNLPAPLFNFVDAGMAGVLPAAVRLAVWAAIGAIGTMLLYKMLSPQARIGEAKRRAKAARQRLNAFDGDFADAGPLIRDQFASAFRHVGLVVPGTMLAILPLLCLLLWAETHYGQALPEPGQAPAIIITPAEGFTGEWQAADEPPHVRVTRNGETVADITMIAPVGVVTKQPWWHWLAANPLGYLPDDAAVEQIRIHLPERHYLSFGPDWMRGWLAIFIPVMFIVSLAIYRWAKIE
ncbi:hypothetical protein [Salinisphaera orenii]|uniref:Uncharacterized protein n=1 Tax=Salinisphaera orenii YIM 95161 TaxID=1051139 RepID=A0A423Q3A2_9GAMM|nr:hypothetical protein [Salinisphaera halophila]ROO33085.1 hypothetical protein SAHL_04010 [Salinisphaera halophila YIM 95161]